MSNTTKRNQIKNASEIPISSVPGPSLGTLKNHGGQTTNIPSQIFDNNLPKILIVHSEDDKRPLASVSPFLVSKALSGIAGTIPNVKKMKSGDLLVTTSTENQSRLLLKAKALADIPITVSPHPTLNFSRGVIYCTDLINLTEEEILDGLKFYKVIFVKQIITKKGKEQQKSLTLQSKETDRPTNQSEETDGPTNQSEETNEPTNQSKKTPLFILTFSTPNLPNRIKAGYLNVSVRPYIPNPLRCFRCQRFGHSITSCRGSATCAKCGCKEHSSEQCTSKACCINCGGDHPAYFKSCPKWQLEKEIQRLRVVNNLSYPDARKQAEAILPPRPKDSYASVAKKTTCSAQTQTDPTYIITRPQTQTDPNYITRPQTHTSSASLTQQKRSSSSIESHISKPTKQIHIETNTETTIETTKPDDKMETEVTNLRKPPKEKASLPRDRSRSGTRAKNTIRPP